MTDSAPDLRYMGRWILWAGLGVASAMSWPACWRNVPSPSTSPSAETSTATPTPVAPPTAPLTLTAAGPLETASAENVGDEPRSPLGFRVARPPTIVYAEPSRRAKRIGRIEGRHPFAIFGVQPGPGCEGEGWAAVDQGGFACLEQAVATDKPPRAQPELPEGQLLPFIYGKPKILDKTTGAIAVVPRYRDYLAVARGEEPIGHLAPDRQYAFVETKKRRAGLLLIDEDDRAVPAQHVKLEKESTFSGRDLAQAPILAGQHAAWSVSRPAVLRAQPSRTAPAVGHVQYHATMHIDPQPIPVADEFWYAVPDGAGPGVSAFIVDEDMNHWIPGPVLADVGADELWIDVELGQQTLAVMKGQEPVFVTLISSGAGGSATPLGLFRIYEKLAVWTMKSAPNSEDPYYVEGVPWIQYFHRRYALHASYWHDAFGKRRSHGCINLSPKDAAYVFSLTSPALPPGWNSLLERPGAAGTIVRVRRGIDPVPDLREPIGTSELDDGATEAESVAGEVDGKPQR